MYYRTIMVVVCCCVTGAPAKAQDGSRTFAVVQRDTSIKPFYTGYSFRSQASGRSGGPARSRYAVITEVVTGSPADKAGLKVGDEILSINGFDKLARPDSARYFGPDIPADLRVRRGDSIVQLRITPITPPPR
jgi:predicted metalloprotease with PDZ domain